MNFDLGRDDLYHRAVADLSGAVNSMTPSAPSARVCSRNFLIIVGSADDSGYPGRP